MDSSKASIQFRIDTNLKNEFDSECSKNSINKSDLMRRLIIEWLEKKKSENRKN